MGCRKYCIPLFFYGFILFIIKTTRNYKDERLQFTEYTAGRKKSSIH